MTPEKHRDGTDAIHAGTRGQADGRDEPQSRCRREPLHVETGPKDCPPPRRPTPVTTDAAIRDVSTAMRSSLT